MTHLLTLRWLTSNASLMVATLLIPAPASAHFLWISAEAPAQPTGPTTIRVYLNELPEPGGPEFLKFVAGVVPTVGGVPLAASTGDESINAPWAGPLPPMIDAERDLGVKTKDGVSYQLYYTARLQTAPVAPTLVEKGGTLRARLINNANGKTAVQVLYDGKPAPKVRIKTYPAEGDGSELTADDQGQAQIDGVAEGKTALWASWTDPTPGTSEGKSFTETRYYATLNCRKPAFNSTSTTFATLPDPAVNSFGGAVLGDWLYVYSGHIGQTHEYSAETTSKHFRRLSLTDRTTWEDLPMGRDVQGVALVSDGRYLYRTGGMTARNPVGQPQDMISSTDFCRFDPETKTWTDLAPMPEARSTHDSAVIGRRIYVVGGWSMKGSRQPSVFLDHAAVFDLDQPDQGWRSFDQPFRRRALAAAEAGGKLYVLGGLTADSEVVRRLDIFDPSTQTWSVGPSIPGSSDRDGFAASAFAVGDRLTMSGMSGIINQFDPKTSTWQAVGAWAQPRITHRVLAGPGHTLLVVGGNFKGEQTPLIEAVTLPATASTTGAGPTAVSR